MLEHTSTQILKTGMSDLLYPSRPFFVGHFYINGDGQLTPIMQTNGFNASADTFIELPKLRAERTKNKRYFRKRCWSCQTTCAAHELGHGNGCRIEMHGSPSWNDRLTHHCSSFAKDDDRTHGHSNALPIAALTLSWRLLTDKGTRDTSLFWDVRSTSKRQLRAVQRWSRHSESRSDFLSCPSSTSARLGASRHRTCKASWWSAPSRGAS